MNTDKTKLLICVYLCSSAALMLLTTGCGSYSNFTLPEVHGGDASTTFRFLADPEPVLTRDEFRDALNPSVTGQMNLYSVYDGQQCTPRWRPLTTACTGRSRESCSARPRQLHCGQRQRAVLRGPGLVLVRKRG
jgi:hypothetical protein